MARDTDKLLVGNMYIGGFVKAIMLRKDVVIYDNINKCKEVILYNPKENCYSIDNVGEYYIDDIINNYLVFICYGDCTYKVLN